MENRGPRICPLCGAPVRLFFINLTEKFLMCEDPSCDFPFGYEQLQIVTDESQLRDNVEWCGVSSPADNDVSSATSMVSTTAWADLEQLTRLYESDASAVDSRSSHQSKQAQKIKEKMEREEALKNNLNHIKKLNQDLNKLNSTQTHGNIEQDNLLENLYRIQKSTGTQMLNREELEILQKSKEAELGKGELKINFNTVPNEMGVINIEICNNDNNEIIKTTDNEAIEKTENKIQINLEEKIAENINKASNIDVVETDQNNETQENNTDICEEIETTNSNPNGTSMEVITTCNTNGNSVIDKDHNVDTLQNQEEMEQETTAVNDMQVQVFNNIQVTPGDEKQMTAVDKVQVLAKVDEVQDFPLITLEELTAKVPVSEPKDQEMDKMQVAIVDEMEVITLNDKLAPVVQEMQVTTLNKTPVLDAIQEPVVLTPQSPGSVDMLSSAVDKMQGTPVKEILVTALVGLPAPEKMQAIPSPTPATTPPVSKKKRGRPRKMSKNITETPDITTSNIITKNSKQDEQNHEQNDQNNVTDKSTKDSEPTKDRNASLELDNTTASNKDQNNESIELSQNDEINTSGESSNIGKEPKKKGRKRGQKKVNKVNEVRRSARLSGKYN